MGSLFFARNLLSLLSWDLSRRDREAKTLREGKEDHTVSDFYNAFLQNRVLVSQDEFCETWSFDWLGAPVVVRMTKAKASRKDEIFCEPNKLRWSHSLPAITSFPHTFLATTIPEETVISDHSFARRGAICVFVVRGKPANFRWIDQHEWIRADNKDDARGKIYLMSEERFKTFEPGEKAAH